jgi:hypothetical protein
LQVYSNAAVSNAGGDTRSDTFRGAVAACVDDKQGHDVIIARHRAGYVRETPHNGSAESAASGVPEAIAPRR